MDGADICIYIYIHTDIHMYYIDLSFHVCVSLLYQLNLFVRCLSPEPLDLQPVSPDPTFCTLSFGHCSSLLAEVSSRHREKWEFLKNAGSSGLLRRVTYLGDMWWDHDFEKQPDVSRLVSIARSSKVV